MKTCTKCSEIKELDCFRAFKRNKDGLSSICKSCHSAVERAHKRTRIGLIKEIYKTQVQNSKKRTTVNAPSYSYKEFELWCLSQESFEPLYLEWVKSKFDKYKRPSADRLDDMRHYTLDNLRLVTFQENLNKAYKDQLNGNNTKQLKPVISIDKHGNEKLYHSMSQAAREIGVDNVGNISSACNGSMKTAYGYNWRFA